MNDNQIVLTERQQEFLDKAIDIFKGGNGGMIVLSGFGGSGKSFSIVQFLIKIQDYIDKEDDCLICAPTQKACSVIKEYLANQPELDIPHKVLTLDKLQNKAIPTHLNRQGHNVEFLKKEKSSISVRPKILIIDEVSMVDNQALKWFVDIIHNERTLVIFAGDYLQLPPVGNEFGANGGYLLQTRSTVEFNEIKRSSGILVQYLYDARKVIEETGSSLKLAEFLEGLSQNDQYKFYNSSDTTRDYLKLLEEYPNAIGVCFTNKLRETLLSQIITKQRKLPLSEFKSQLPSLNDKIILQDNCIPLGIFNGKISTIAEVLNSMEQYNKENVIAIDLVFNFQGNAPKNPKDEWWIANEKKRTTIYAEDETRDNGRKTVMKAELSRFLENEGINSRQISFDDDDEALTLRQKRIISAVEKLKKNKFSMTTLLELPILATILNKVIAKFPNRQQYFMSVDFGNILTAHKAQGSGFQEVIYIMEKGVSLKHMYTGISRAEEKLIILKQEKKGK